MNRTGIIGDTKEHPRMSHRLRWGGRWALIATALGLIVSPAAARTHPGEYEYDAIKQYEQEVMAQMQGGNVARRGGKPLAVPDIFGPGSVLTVGNVIMKVTNNGLIGNPFITSSDPSCQWPGTSSV